ILVINKSDLPFADQVAAQVRASVELSGHATPVLRVSAKTGQGMAELWRAIQTVADNAEPVPASKDLLRVAQQELKVRFQAALAAGDRNLQNIIKQFQEGRISAAEAGLAVWKILQDQ